MSAVAAAIFRLHVSAKCRLNQSEERALFEMADIGDSILEVENRRLFLEAVKSSEEDGSSVVCRVIYPEIPDGAQTFFEGGHDDYAWLQRSVGKTFADLSLSGYRRPGVITASGGSTKPILGIEALNTLHEWLKIGLRIRLGKLKLGFLLFYEMLTATLPIKILDTDSPDNYNCYHHSIL